MAVARLWRHPSVRAALALSGLGILSLGVAELALGQRSLPQRCPEGMSQAGPRCCGVAQAFRDGICSGLAVRCATTQDLNQRGQCVARGGVVRLAGGVLSIGAADWDGASGAERFPTTRVGPFRLDLVEVTRERFEDATQPSTGAMDPGLPITNLSPEAAEAFCRSRRGRLPTAAEWVWAAAGPDARRYPWGNAGLVCRRAAFGLDGGPCADAGGPELVGSRPDGATPQGVLDLAGNVAEWTKESDGSFAARGGSFRSTSAAELKSWSVMQGREKALHIGFRCAYPP
jgi:formylglycine-generating enzyme